MVRNILIFDTTLRDGEQSPGATMTVPEKLEVADALVARLKAIGYKYVTLDLQGYRTGSLNEVLHLRPI